MQKEERITICRFCLKQCEMDFDVIEDSTKEILRSLLLKLDLDVSQDSLMCKSCSKHLQASYDFKLTCLYTEDCISSFVHDTNDIKPNLTEIYARKNNLTVSKRVVICRLCMKLVKSTSRIFLNDEKKDGVLIKLVLGKFVPELDLNITENPTVCTSCYTFLQKHNDFLIRCLSIEQKIKKYCEVKGRNGQSQISLERVLHFEPIENEENSEIKIKQENTGETDTEELNIKQEELDLKPDQDDLRPQNDAAVSPDTSKVVRYKCVLCTFMTKRKRNVKLHMEVHKKASERHMYLCELCAYKTKQISTLKRHIIMRHKDASEITKYKCEVCSYECTHKSYLWSHMFSHKNTSQVVPFQCKICEFMTKYKGNLKMHMEVHKNASERSMYLCELCSYKARRKHNLKRHIMLNHKDASEVTVYKCEACSYECKEKSYLRNHLLTHKRDSEVVMFKCQLCTFKTKYKRHLVRHMLTHKSVSELTMYKCEVCSFETKYKGYLKRHKLIHPGAN